MDRCEITMYDLQNQQCQGGDCDGRPLRVTAPVPCNERKRVRKGEVRRRQREKSKDLTYPGGFPCTVSSAPTRNK